MEMASLLTLDAIDRAIGEARSKAANSKAQDKAGAEAKAGVVGCLRPPGGEDGVAEDSSEAA